MCLELFVYAFCSSSPPSSPMPSSPSMIVLQTTNKLFGTICIGRVTRWPNCASLHTYAKKKDNDERTQPNEPKQMRSITVLARKNALNLNQSPFAQLIEVRVNYDLTWYPIAICFIASQPILVIFCRHLFSTLRSRLLLLLHSVYSFVRCSLIGFFSVVSRSVVFCVNPIWSTLFILYGNLALYFNSKRILSKSNKVLRRKKRSKKNLKFGSDHVEFVECLANLPKDDSWILWILFWKKLHFPVNLICTLGIAWKEVVSATIAIISGIKFNLKFSKCCKFVQQADFHVNEKRMMRIFCNKRNLSVVQILPLESKELLFFAVRHGLMYRLPVKIGLELWFNWNGLSIAGSAIQSPQMMILLPRTLFLTWARPTRSGTIPSHISAFFYCCPRFARATVMRERESDIVYAESTMWTACLANIVEWTKRSARNREREVGTQREKHIR